MEVCGPVAFFQGRQKQPVASIAFFRVEKRQPEVGGLRFGCFSGRGSRKSSRKSPGNVFQAREEAGSGKSNQKSVAQSSLSLLLIIALCIKLLLKIFHQIASSRALTKQLGCRLLMAFPGPGKSNRMSELSSADLSQDLREPFGTAAGAQ